MDQDEPSGDRSPLEGEVLGGRWRVVRLMARGEAGALFEGAHVEIGDAVRIWVLKPRLAAIPEVLRRLSFELARIDHELGAPRWLDAASDEASGVTYVVADPFGEGELVRDRFSSADDLRTALLALMASAPPPTMAMSRSPPPAAAPGASPELSLDWLRQRRRAAARAGVAPYAFAGPAQLPAAEFEPFPAAAAPPSASPAPANGPPRAMPPTSASAPAGRRRRPHPALWGSAAAIGALVIGSTALIQSGGPRLASPAPLVGAPAPTGEGAAGPPAMAQPAPLVGAPAPTGEGAAGPPAMAQPIPASAPSGPLQALLGAWSAGDCADALRLEASEGRLVTHRPDGSVETAEIERIGADGAITVKARTGQVTYRADGDTLVVTDAVGHPSTFARCPQAGGAVNAATLGGEATLIAMAMAGASGSDPQPPAPPRDEVDVSAFAPKQLRAGDAALVQIYLHLVDQAESVADRARAAEAEAELRGQTTLGLELVRGTRVDVMLDAGGLGVDEPIQSVVWRGRPCACQFAISAPTDLATGRRVLTARLLVDGVPLGRLAFSLAVSRDAAPTAPPQLTGDAARRYARAFLSYSSLDRPEVLKTAQTLQATGIDYFQDILSIEPGEAWRERLFAEIDRCDLFLLFWSSHAAGSDWVRQEAEYALARHRGSSEAPPDIRPIILEGPPIPLPPASLASLHFNDMLRYVVVASELEARARAGDRGGA